MKDITKPERPVKELLLLFTYNKYNISRMFNPNIFFILSKVST